MKHLLSIFAILLTLSNITAQKKVANLETVAILPMSGANIPSDELTIYSDRLEAELFKQDQYTFVERQMMSEVLKEQGFQQSGCTTDECAVEIGQLLGVKFLITGSLGKLGKLYTINLKMIDVETGKIKYKNSYDCDCSPEDLLTSGLNNVVNGMFGVSLSTKTTESKSETLIIIDSNPVNARVHIGGKYVGKTPLTLVDYKKGSYSMMVLLPGFKTYRSNIKVDGSSRDYKIQLEKK